MFSLGTILENWYRKVSKFRKPHEVGDVINPYDIPGELLQYLQQQKLLPFTVQELDLGTATDNKEFNIGGGMHVVAFGFETGSPTKVPATDIYMSLSLEAPDQTGSAFPLKHNRGFSGPFSKFYLSWPAQPGKSVSLVVYKGMNYPWISGEFAT